MSNVSGDKKKVIGLVSGNSTGKTTLSECFLFNSGATDRLGNVESKNTVSDNDPIEKDKGFSINSSVLNYNWEGYHVDLVDTPGYIDFIGKAYAATQIIDGALFLVNPKSGIQATSERIIRLLKQKHVPTFCVFNKLDQENLDFFSSLEEVKSNYNINLVPITIPTETGEDFSQVIDLLKNKAFNYKPDSSKGEETEVAGKHKENAESHHNELIESIVETDDELLSKYLEGENISSELVAKNFKKAVLEGKVIPLFSISSGKNFGIDILMGYINQLMPSPLETNPVKASKIPDGSEAEIQPTEGGPVCGYVFKTMSDPYIGKLSVFRLFSGQIKANENYYVSGAKKSFKFSNIFDLQGKEQTGIEEATCGDIVAVSKITEISNDDTISSEDNPLEIEKVKYPEPTLPRTIIPLTKGDEEKINSGLSRLIEEDPTLKQEIDSETSQNLVWGMGELHLSIVKESLKKKFEIGAELQIPEVAYKETIKKEIETEYKYKKQSGGRGQYGHVFLKLKPKKHGEDYEFEDTIFGGAIPKGYIPGVEKGVVEAMKEGVLAKYPVVDVHVNLFDGSFHSVDSSEMAFKIAASMAFKKGMQQASPCLLEPIMELEIIVPEEYMGDIIGDINSRRGKIISMTPSDNKTQTIKANVPQAETFNYAIDLISITKGRGFFKQNFSHYEELPPNLTEKLIEERQKEKDEK
ncbi:MAG: elongation factor G [Actinomycetota bacterium]